MAKNDLLKEAIADAKTVRNTALANAKAALEEAFTPKLKSMLSAKLTEELEEEIDEAPQGFYEEDIEEGKEVEAGTEEDEANEEVMDEEISLEEILAELELEEGGATEEKTGEEEDKASEAPKNDDLDEEIDLNEIFNENEMDEEIDLNELLAELSEDDEVEEGYFSGDKFSITKGQENPWDENFAEALKAQLGLSGGALAKLKSLPGDVLAKLKQHLFPDAKYKQSGNKLKNPKYPSFHKFEEGIDETSNEELEEMRDELNEAIKVIKYQKGKLNEVNVLNSKLLYVNKLFKAYNLTENQKIKVVDSLDQADNTKEAKIIYNTLNETFSSVRTQLKESIKPKSFASKATGLIKENRTRKAQPVNETVARFKKLANIN